VEDREELKGKGHDGMMVRTQQQSNENWENPKNFPFAGISIVRVRVGWM
jgi:hypothetical protein